MSGSCTWTEPCTACKGEGKVNLFDPKTNLAGAEIDCPVCDGRKYTMVKKEFTRRNDK